MRRRLNNDFQQIRRRAVWRARIEWIGFVTVLAALAGVAALFSME